MTRRWWNLTPHAVTVRLAGGLGSLEYEPAPHQLRVKQEYREPLTFDGVPPEISIKPVEWGILELELDTAVQIERGDCLLVSSICAQAIKDDCQFIDRADFREPLNLADVLVFVPDSGPESAIRDAAGKIIAVRNLIPVPTGA